MIINYYPFTCLLLKKIRFCRGNISNVLNFDFLFQNDTFGGLKKQR